MYASLIFFMVEQNVKTAIVIFPTDTVMFIFCGPQGHSSHPFLFLLQIKLSYNHNLSSKLWKHITLLSYYHVFTLQPLILQSVRSLWLRYFLQAVGVVRYKIKWLKVEKHHFIFIIVPHVDNYIFHAQYSPKQPWNEIIGVKWFINCAEPKSTFRPNCRPKVLYNER